jgi:NAD(P)-dependent dehydrogenase (short-subunit alcohol dehydrogenase family)
VAYLAGPAIAAVACPNKQLVELLDVGVDLFSLDGKHAVVTGGARGVGLVCARALLAHGASVTITVRHREAGEKACDELAATGHCELVVVDLAAPAGVEELGRALARRGGPVDVLVNNAGVTWGATIEDYPPAAWDKVLRLDVAAPFQVVQAALPLLEAGADRNAPARVVNIGSIDGHAVGSFDNYAYSASKAAIHHLTRVLAFRLGPRRITVNCIAPGPIRTDMTARLIDGAAADLHAANPLGRLCEPDDVAGALVYLTARAGAYVTGAVIPVDGGFAASPWWAGPPVSQE